MLKVSLKPDFIVHDIAGEKVLLGAGSVVDFSQMLMLNETAARVVAALQAQPSTPDELAAMLAEEYDISCQEARRDVEALLARMVELGIVSENQI